MLRRSAAKAAAKLLRAVESFVHWSGESCGRLTVLETTHSLLMTLFWALFSVSFVAVFWLTLLFLWAIGRVVWHAAT